MLLRGLPTGATCGLPTGAGECNAAMLWNKLGQVARGRASQQCNSRSLLPHALQGRERQSFVRYVCMKSSLNGKTKTQKPADIAVCTKAQDEQPFLQPFQISVNSTGKNWEQKG